MINWTILDLTFIPGVKYMCGHVPYSDDFCASCKQHNYSLTKQYLDEYVSNLCVDEVSDLGYIITVGTEQRLPDMVNGAVDGVKAMMISTGSNPENIKIVTCKFNNLDYQLSDANNHKFDYSLHAYENRRNTKFNTKWDSSSKQILYMPGKPTAPRLNILSEFIKQGQIDDLKYSLLEPSSTMWYDFYIQHYMQVFPDQTEADAIAFMKKYKRTLDVTSLERQSHTQISKHHNNNMDIYHKGAVVVSHHIDVCVYQDVCMRLVSETGSGVQTTEKTWTPIMDSVPFFLTNGSYDYIESQGFKTYNNFVKSGLAEAALTDATLLPELTKQFQDASEVRSKEIQEVIDYNSTHFFRFVKKEEKKLRRFLPEGLNYDNLKVYILGLYD